MENWTQHKVEDLIKQNILSVGDGYRAKNSELSKNGLPFARGANINQGFLLDDADCLDLSNLSKAGEKVSRIGDVVFTSKGTVGRFAFVKEETPKFVYSPQLCYWRVLNRDFIEPRFLYYWIHGKEFFGQYNGVKGQTDMADYVSLINQRRFHIMLPPIEEQKAIAKILSALDDKIELNRLMNQTLEQMARAVFKAWFVDFEPVRANLENRASASASPEIAKLFPSEFENGLPKGWEVKKLNDVLELAYGKALKEENRVVGNFPVYGSNGQVGWHNELLVEGAGIVVGRKGNPGTITWIDESFFPIDTTFYVKSKFDLKFLFYILQNLDLPNLSGDSAVPGLSRSIAYKESVVIPSNGLIETFGNVVTDIRKKCFMNRKESNNLSQIRDSVLPRLISGKIRVC